MTISKDRQRKIKIALTVLSSSQHIGQHIFFSVVVAAGSSMLDVEAMTTPLFCSLVVSLSTTSCISSSALNNGLFNIFVCAKRQDGNWLIGSPRYILFTH